MTEQTQKISLAGLRQIEKFRTKGLTKKSQDESFSSNHPRSNLFQSNNGSFSMFQRFDNVSNLSSGSLYFGKEINDQKPNRVESSQNNMEMINWQTERNNESLPNYSSKYQLQKQNTSKQNEMEQLMQKQEVEVGENQKEKGQQKTNIIQNTVIIHNQNLSKKKKSLKKSNAMKNFANQFVSYFSCKQNIQKLLEVNNINKNQYKNIVDNLKKKIKYQERAQKVQDIKSMLQHKNKIYEGVIIKACRDFAKIYPQIIYSSSKMKDAIGNQKIIDLIINVMDQLTRQK